MNYKDIHEYEDFIVTIIITSAMTKKKDKTLTRRLTEKQERFCQFYLDTDGNASEAYRMAYDASNMQPETVWSNASRLMDNNKVEARIAEIRAERAENTRIERNRVEKVLMDIVTADPNDLYIADARTGKIKMRTPTQLPKRMRNALKKIKNAKGIVEYEMHGKVEAARLLGAWNGWDAPKEVSVKNSGNMMGEIRIGFDDD